MKSPCLLLIGAALAFSTAIAAPVRSNDMAYVELADLKDKVSDRDLLQMLDDNQDGAIDNDVWAQIQAGVQTEIDGTLGQRYQVPFTDPIPAVVKLAAKRLAIESVYGHRNLLGEKMPYVVDANATRKLLQAIAHGDVALAPEKKGVNPSGSVIAEPSKTYHCPR